MKNRKHKQNNFLLTNITLVSACIVNEKRKHKQNTSIRQLQQYYSLAEQWLYLLVTLISVMTTSLTFGADMLKIARIP